MLNDLIRNFPEIAALIVLAIGFGVGKLAQNAVVHLLALTERLIARFGTRQESIFSPVFQKAFGLLAYGAVLVIAIVLAIRLLDINQLSRWLDQTLDYVPRLIIGLLIIGLGNVLGALARSLVASLNSRWSADALIPRFVHGAIIAIAIITGLQQLGLNISFVTQMALIVLGAVLGGLSLAFALGANTYVANLLAHNELTRYRAGERLRIDGDEGTVVEIHQTGLVLATQEGLVAVPAARLAAGRVVKLTSETVGS